METTSSKGAVEGVLKNKIKDKENDYKSEEFRKKFRSGVCMSTQNRHWELAPFDFVISELERGRVIAVDMESATIAANGYRHRVPFGALLQISDLPLLGELKMRDMSTEFYEKSSGDHFQIGLKSVEKLHNRYRKQLKMTRRLNGLDDPLLS